MPPVRAEGCHVLQQQQQQPSPKMTANSRQPMGNIKFTEEETIRLVHAFKARQCLWNREVGRQVGTDGRKKAYLELVREVGKDGFGLEELKRKIKILRSTYNQEVAKMKKLAEIGYDKHYYPNLKWFHLMHEIYSSEGVDSNRANSPDDSSLVRIKEEPPLEVEDVEIRGGEDESTEPPPEAECILGCPPSPTSQQPLDPLRKDGRPLKRSLRDVKSPEKTSSELKVPRLSDQISITVRNLKDSTLATTDPLSGTPIHQFQEGLGRTTDSPVLEQARPFHISLTPIRDLQEQPNKSVPGPATVRLQQSSDVPPLAAGQTATEDLPRRAANEAADQNDKFAEYVAAQLRQLPLRNALKLQEKIQSLITKERLACLQD